MIQLLILLAWFIPLILFLLTQQNLLLAIKKKNRALAPGLVWLQLIPFFSLIWQFIVVYRTSISIRNQLFSPVDGDSELGLETIAATSTKTSSPTLGTGMAYCILLTSGMVLQFSGVILNEFLVLLEFIILIGWLVCWIIYWVQIARFKQFFRYQYFQEANN